MHEANLTSEAPVADAEASQSGQLAAQLRQSVLHGLNCGSDVEYGCVETKATMLLELICVMITFALSCWGGWLFSQYYFTRATSQAVRLERSVARRFFCVVFGACCNAIVIILFELLDVLSFDFRLAALKAHIATLVLFMLCAIPCYHTYAVFRACLAPRPAAAATGAAQLALLYLLLRALPPWWGVPEPPHAGLFSFRVAVLRTGVLGVCAIAVLAGFGTVDFPYGLLRAFVVPVSAYEVQALQTQLQQVRDQMAFKEQELARLEAERAAADSSQAKGARTWLAGLSSALAPQSAASERLKALQLGVEGLAVMEATLAADVAELAAEADRDRAAQTPFGRVRNAFGYVLAAYCVLKMLASLKAVLFGEDFTSDPVTRILSLALRLFSGGALVLNAKAASQYITLLFVGFVSFNSLRTFLKHIRRLATSLDALLGGGGAALAAAPPGKSALVSSTERMMLLLGAVLCAYTVSSAMLVRAQLPVAHRGLVTRALGFDERAADGDLDAVHRWFNGMQLASMVATGALFYWQFSNKKANALGVGVV